MAVESLALAAGKQVHQWLLVEFQTAFAVADVAQRNSVTHSLTFVKSSNTVQIQDAIIKCAFSIWPPFAGSFVAAAIADQKKIQSSKPSCAASFWSWRERTMSFVRFKRSKPSKLELAS